MRIILSSLIQKKFVTTVFFLLLLLNNGLCMSMVDNRFRDPALNHKAFVITDPAATDFLSLQPYIERADHATGRDQEKGLFDYGAPYRLYDVDAALLESGIIQNSLIPTFWRGVLTNGPYRMNGRMQNQGVTFHWYHLFSDYWGMGLRGEFIHSNTALVLVRDPGFDRVLLGNPPSGDDYQLTLVNYNIAQALQLHSFIWSKFAFGDVELYARFFSHTSYAYKCRYIDAGATVGMIFPAAPERDIFNPASIPLGGNGHWGIFAEVNLDAELRHDMRMGFAFRGQKRFSRTQLFRSPHDKEPTLFGAVIGRMKVDPGWSLFFQPYLIKEGLREGFGIRVAYTGVKHFKDHFTDYRCDKSVSINFCRLEEESEWGQDYVTLGFIYDFAYGKRERCFEPVVTLTVDVPVEFVMASRCFQTYGIAAGIEMSF